MLGGTLRMPNWSNKGFEAMCFGVDVVEAVEAAEDGAAPSPASVFWVTYIV
jgi:hypothetical protein